MTTALSSGAGIIDKSKLVDLKYSKGMSIPEIADYFDVSQQAVRKALKRLKEDNIAGLYSQGHQFMEQHVTSQTVLVGLMKDASDLLSECRTAIDGEWDGEGIVKRKFLLSSMAEMRAQLKMYMDMQKELFSAEANLEFQEIVIGAIREENEDVAEKIIARLQRRQPLRQFVGEAGRSR